MLLLPPLYYNIPRIDTCIPALVCSIDTGIRYIDTCPPIFRIQHHYMHLPPFDIDLHSALKYLPCYLIKAVERITTCPPCPLARVAAPMKPRVRRKKDMFCFYYCPCYTIFRAILFSVQSKRGEMFRHTLRTNSKRPIRR